MTMDYFKSEATRRVFAEHTSLPILNYSICESNKDEPFRYKNEYELRVKFGVTFIANDAEYQDALLNAEKLLQRELFADKITILYEIKSDLYSGDISAAHKKLNKLAELMGV